MQKVLRRTGLANRLSDAGGNKPVGELTNFRQKSSSSVAYAAKKWMDLLVNGPSELHPFLEYHPVYRGKWLNDEQLKEVRAHIFEKLDGPGLESCREFTSN